MDSEHKKTIIKLLPENKKKAKMEALAINMSFYNFINYLIENYKRI